MMLSRSSKVLNGHTRWAATDCGVRAKVLHPLRLQPCGDPPLPFESTHPTPHTPQPTTHNPHPRPQTPHPAPHAPYPTSHTPQGPRRARAPLTPITLEPITRGFVPNTVELITRGLTPNILEIIARGGLVQDLVLALPTFCQPVYT